jgi:hypothetical protein
MRLGNPGSFEKETQMKKAGLGYEAANRISALRDEAKEQVAPQKVAQEELGAPEGQNLKIQALAEFLGVDPSEISETSYGEFETPEGEYRVYTDEEANAATREDIENSLWAFNVDFMSNFMVIDVNANVEKALQKVQSDLSEDANDIMRALVG